MQQRSLDRRGRAPSLADQSVPCPYCGTTMRLLDRDRQECWEWVCPVSLLAMDKGLLGKPGRKHKAAWLFSAKDAQKILDFERRKTQNANDEGDALVGDRGRS